MTHHHACRHALDFTLPGAVAHYPPDLGLEPIHLDIDLHVDVPAKTCAGTVTHTLEARRADAHEIVLHAVDFESVEASCVEGHAIRTRYDGRELHVHFEAPFAKGEKRQLAVRYRIEEPVTGLFFYGPSPRDPDAALVAATDHETERARHWLPTIDLPSCRPTLAWHLRARKDFTILANGRRTGEEAHADGTKTVHWSLEQRCPSYLTCFAIGELIEWKDKPYEGIPVASYTTRHFQPSDLERSYGRTRDMLAWMSKKLDYPFPFPKYFQFALPGFGGAMENISLVSWDDMFVLDEKLAREWTWLVDQINLHEMAHSYFGDLIVCRDFAHAWLKESWAVYMETLWLEDSKGAEEAHYDVLRNVDNYLDEADTAYQRPIVTREFNQSWQMYDRHLYPGGASRLHMLRKELGDDVFFEGVRLYVRRFAGQMVETDDFRKSLEEASGRSLVRWFDQWIAGPGYPNVKVGYTRDANRKIVAFTVEQTQVDDKTGKKPFAFSLDLLIASGEDAVVHRVEIDRAKHVFEFPAREEPHRVEVDPYGRTVMKLEFEPGADKLRALLAGATTVVGRIRAARTLCKSGKRKNLEAVRDAHAKEPFWGARLAMAQAMGKATSDDAVTHLAAWIATEQEPLALEGTIRAAGAMRDARIREALEARLDKDIGLYRATAAALEVLGMQRANAPLERLVRATKAVDPYGLEAQGAFRALAHSRHASAADLLVEHLEPGAAPDRVRWHVALALGMLGRLLGDGEKTRIGEALCDRLRDPCERMRARAVLGLGMLGWAGSSAPLRAYQARISDQERVAVERALEQIRAAQQPPAKAAEKALEDLRAEVRTIEGRVGNLEARTTDSVATT